MQYHFISLTVLLRYRKFFLLIQSMKIWCSGGLWKTEVCPKALAISLRRLATICTGKLARLLGRSPTLSACLWSVLWDCQAVPLPVGYWHSVWHSASTGACTHTTHTHTCTHTQTYHFVHLFIPKQIYLLSVLNLHIRNMKFRKSNNPCQSLCTFLISETVCCLAVYA